MDKTVVAGVVVVAVVIFSIYLSVVTLRMVCGPVEKIVWDLRRADREEGWIYK